LSECAQCGPPPPSVEEGWEAGAWPKRMHSSLTCQRNCLSVIQMALLVQHHRAVGASDLRTQPTLVPLWALRSTLMFVDQRAVGLG